MSRYIDADALEKTLGAWVREHWTEAFTGDDAGAEFIDMIDDEETIDTAPIIHAHWIREPEDTAYENVRTCSNCSEELIQHRKPKYRFCPDCGAKMVKDEDYITPEDKYSKEDIDNAVNLIHDYCAAHHDTCNCCYLAHSIFCDVKNPESWTRFNGDEL